MLAKRHYEPRHYADYCAADALLRFRSMIRWRSAITTLPPPMITIIVAINPPPRLFTPRHYFIDCLPCPRPLSLWHGGREGIRAGGRGQMLTFMFLFSTRQQPQPHSSQQAASSLTPSLPCHKAQHAPGQVALSPSRGHNKCLIIKGHHHQHHSTPLPSRPVMSHYYNFSEGWGEGGDQ